MRQTARAHFRGDDSCQSPAPVRTPLVVLPCLIVLLLAFLGAGCVELEQTIQVRADGSGVVLSDVFFSEKMVAEMTGSGEDWENTWKEALPQMEESGPQAAAALGEGVRFVSVEDISTAARPGARFTFAFDDVAKVRPNPMAPLASELPGGDSADEDPIELSFDRSGTDAVLSVKLFEDDEEIEERFGSSADGADGAEISEPAGADEDLGAFAQGMEDAMVEMFKELFDGFALRLSIEPLGRLVETNASFVEGALITLFDLDFGKLLDKPDALAALGEGGPGEPTLADLRKAFASIEGARIDLQPTVRIVFAEE